MSLQSRLDSLISAIGADVKKLRGVVTTTTTATLTPTPSVLQYNLTAQSGNLTIASPGDSPSDGQALTIRIKDNGSARTISWNAIYRAIGVTLPTTTVANKTLYVSMKYNTSDTRWDVLAVGQEA